MHRRLSSLAILTLAFSLGASVVASTASATCPGHFKSAIHLGRDTVLPADAQGVILQTRDSWFATQPKATWYDHLQMVNLDNDENTLLPLHINNSPASEGVYLIEPVRGFVPGDRYQLRFVDCKTPSSCDVKHRWDFEVDTLSFRDVLASDSDVYLNISELQSTEGRIGREVSLALPERAERWRDGLLYQVSIDGETSSDAVASTSCAAGAEAHDEQVSRFVRASLVMPGVWDAAQVSGAAHVPLSCDLIAGQFTAESLEITKAVVQREAQQPSLLRGLMVVISILIAFAASMAVRDRFGE